MTQQIERPNLQDSGDQAMTTLQRQWYNALIAGLSLNPSTFQTVQASQPLGNTSDALWQYFDSVPPYSLNQVFAASAFNSFSNNYRGVINTILPQGGSQFRQVMGDNLTAWNDYKKTLKPGDIQAAGGLQQIFSDWAQLNLDPDVASKAITIFQQFQNGIVNLAVTAVNNPSYFSDSGVAVYSKTIQDLRDAIPQGQTRTVSFDSQTQSSDTSNTWAQGEVSGFYDFFSADAGGSYNQLSRKATASRVTVEATFQHVISFAAKPGGWYSSSALNLAYQTQDNTVWPAGQVPTWQTTFGNGGNMLRLAPELVVVDGIDAVITSFASYSSEEQETIKANASVGFWPFFSASASGGHSTDVQFNDSGNMVVHISSPAGNPTVLGVNVLPIAQILGSDS